MNSYKEEQTEGWERVCNSEERLFVRSHLVNLNQTLFPLYFPGDVQA